MGKNIERNGKNLRSFKNSETSAQKIVAYVEYPGLTIIGISNGIGLPFPEKPVDNPLLGTMLPIVNIQIKEEYKSQ